MNKPYLDLVLHMLNTILDEEPELTEWEQGFIVSMKTQVTKHNKISRKQFEILELIYADTIK